MSKYKEGDFGKLANAIMQSKPNPKPIHPEHVVAHQLLAAAKIIVEQLTNLGYDDQFASADYEEFKSKGLDDQAAIRMIAAAVNAYDPKIAATLLTRGSK